MADPATVYIVSSRAAHNRGLLQRFGDLIDRLGLSMVSADDTVAIKVHFGDEGTTSFVRPQFSRVLVDRVKARGAHPFLTDTCTLYAGPRQQAVPHLELALRNGFSYATVNAPLVIADGIGGRDVTTVPLSGRQLQEVRYGSAVHNADALLCISKVKGHLAAGFGGTLKNLSMGLGSRAMKQAMHADVRPELRDEGLCEACGECVDICPSDAVQLQGGLARFDHQACVGCAECIAACRPGALRIQFDGATNLVQEKMVEVAEAVLCHKAGRVAFFNVVVDVTPDCDCFRWSDNLIVNHVGILAAQDPVAIDQAAVDLINQQPGLPESKLPAAALAPGSDKFRGLYPKIDWTRQLAYAEERGLGTRRYRLVALDDDGQEQVLAEPH